MKGFKFQKCQYHTLFAVLLFSLALILIGAVNVNDELAKIKAEINAERKKLEEAEAEQGKILAQMDLLEKKIRFYNDKLKELERKRDELVKKIRALEIEIQKVKKDMEDRKKLLSKRLEARYKMGEVGGLQILFSSESISSLVLLDEYMGRIYAMDQELIQAYEDDLKKLSEARKSLEDEKARLEANIAGERWAKEQVELESNKKKELLESIQKEAEKHLAVIAELDLSAQQLEKKLRSLEQGSVRQSEFALFQGKLCMPVSGAIEERFGEKIDPNFKTRTMQKGIDIRAKKGEKVRAIYGGNVVYADWFRGYGNLVIIDHGSNYYSLYAHLDRIDKVAGQSVQKGEAIGTVGETGSLKGPYLYFEMRHHSEAINPELWLNTNCVYTGK